MSSEQVVRPVATPEPPGDSPAPAVPVSPPRYLCPPLYAPHLFDEGDAKGVCRCVDCDAIEDATSTVPDLPGVEAELYRMLALQGYLWFNRQVMSAQSPLRAGERLVALGLAHWDPREPQKLRPGYAARGGV